MRTYVAFDLGISLGEVSKVTYHPDVSDPPDDVFTWRVVCDQGTVTITTRESKKVVEVGRATWSRRKLGDRWCKADGYPNEHQWTLVGNALDAHDAAGAPKRKGRSGAPASAGARQAGSRQNLWIIAGVAILMLGITSYTLMKGEPPPPAAPKPVPTVTAPAPPPPPEPLEVRIAKAATLDEALTLARPTLEIQGGDAAEVVAHYAAPKLRWDDVASATTSIGMVLKDPGTQRGKRLCATGTIVSIERRDVEQRPVYRGALHTPQNDSIEFLAVGSTGTLVRRDQGTLCGVVLGKAGETVRIVGMFDLPENRSPAVEREVP